MPNSEINSGLLFNQEHFNLLIKLYKSSFIDYITIEDIYKTVTETAVKGLNITRASYWEIENQNLVCKNLFDTNTNEHTFGTKLFAKDLPVYFQALKDGIAIIADDVNTNIHTQELKEEYLIPLGIKNMLDLPLRKDGQLIGVFCCEHNQENGAWSESDLAFSRVLCDILNLMIEHDKRRDLEKQLLETEKKISLITKNSNDGFVLIENDFITYASSSYAEMLGFSTEEITNFTTLDLFSHMHKEDVEKTKEYIFKNLEEKNKYFKYQFRIRSKSGKYFWREDSASVLYDEEGNYTKYLIISRDISQMKSAEEKAHKQTSISKDLNAKLSNFTHIVSHNIRSNTSNMAMLIDLIEDTKSVTEKKEYFRLLKNSNNKLSETISHLSETIDIQLNSKKQKTEIKVKTEIKNIISTFKEEISDGKISIQLNIDKDLVLNTIPPYFESIITNLTSNAIKYKSTERNSVIKIYATREKRKTIIAIEDNGVGIDLSKNKDKIFGMYKTFHENPDAIGLGLYMTKNKVNVLGGTIEVESKINEGTVFKIIF